MKKLLILAMFFLLPLQVTAEEIRSLVSDITLKSDGSFTVTETIVYDFEGQQRHGIFRVIPTGHFQKGDGLFRERQIEIDITSVTINSEPVPYEVSSEFKELKVKIGDPNKTISGVHEYAINYEVRGALSYYDSGEVDLYWNAIGNVWQVPIRSALVKVFDPAGMAASEASCYFGPDGSNDECEIVVLQDVTEFGPVSLSPGEGLTIAQAIDPSMVERLIIERMSLWLLWLVGALAWFVGLTWFLYRYYVHHKTGASIIAQYEPYEGFKPMYTGLLFDGRIDPHDITAGIVYLAEQGFFKITRIGRKKFFLIEVDDYEITLRRPYDEVETDFQKQIFTLLFTQDAAVGSVIVLSKLAKDTAKQIENFKTLTALRKAAEADLVAQGFFEYHWQKLGKIALGLAFWIVSLLILTAYVGAEIFVPIIIAAATLIISLIAMAFVYRRRTRKGYEALDYLKGFKEFLSVTDKERFKFHNAPTKSPEQFMAYLPYAIAFGVEKEWAEVFKDISIPAPDWYDGNGSAFSAVYLSQSLGTFGTTVASASGASTASSGGGSAGGGAGGGGGGSW